jgi:hypothetical protein
VPSTTLMAVSASPPATTSLTSSGVIPEHWPTPDRADAGRVGSEDGGSPGPSRRLGVSSGRFRHPHG